MHRTDGLQSAQEHKSWSSSRSEVDRTFEEVWVASQISYRLRRPLRQHLDGLCVKATINLVSTFTRIAITLTYMTGMGVSNCLRRLSVRWPAQTVVPTV